MPWLRMIARLARHDGGGPAFEFALVLPFLVTLLIGGVEVGRIVVLDQKIDRVAGAMADLVAQAETITAAELDALLVAARHIASPFRFEEDGAVIVSSVSVDARGRAVVNWQRQGGGRFPVSSAIGRPGRTATLPAGFSLEAGETAIVAESYYDFHPMMLEQAFPARVVQHVALFRPRLGTLQTLD